MNDASSLPIFKTRKFWLTIFLLVLIPSTLLFLFSIGEIDNVNDFIFRIVFSLGGGLLILLGNILLGTVGTYVGAGLYFLFFTYVFYQILNANRINVFLAVLLFIAMVTGLAYAYLLGGFYS